MAVCRFCSQEMHEADGCVKIRINIAGVSYEPIPYGKETRHGEISNPERCHDCAAKLGNFHHVNCDWEECPKCHGQLIGCDCELDQIKE
jgi:hypothetical protein